MRVFPASVIDRDGLHKCNLRGLREALWACQPADVCLVDGFKLGPTAPPHRAIVDGDTKSAAIAAASIIAKVTRDRYMRTADALYPGYGFASHVGYITQSHTEIVRERGPCEIHRRSWRARARTSPQPRNPAERRAARWYRLRGYRILDTNCWLAGAEIDVVARRGRTLVFCEVKSKSGERFGDPLEMVDAGEGRRVRRAAAAWLACHQQSGRPRCALRRDRRAGREDRAPGRRVLGAAATTANSASWASRRSRSTQGLDLDLSWSERELPERVRTKHVHRLHPYLGKYIPQLVEELFRRHVAVRRTRARPVRRLWHDARAGARERARVGRRRHRGVQLPADAGQDGQPQPVRVSSTTCATRSRGSSAERATRPARRRTSRAGSRREARERAAALPLACGRVRACRRAARRAHARGALGAADDAFRSRLPEGAAARAVLVPQARRECRPVEHAEHFIRRYTLDTLTRLKEFARVRSREVVAASCTATRGSSTCPGRSTRS